MICRHCSAQLPEGATHCPGCQAEVINLSKESRVQRACPTCDSEIFPASRFCWNCGAPLGAPDAPSSSRALEERRQVTILHADIVGFTEFAERLDPEAVKERLDGILGVLIGEVVLRGGTVDKLIGDAVLALFGVPDALGDDAVRAVEAGLAMHRALSDLQGEGEDMSIRVGIETGLVVVGRLGGGLRPTVTGEALFQAISLESRAPVGGVVVGPKVYAQVRGAFRCRRLESAEQGESPAWLIEGAEVASALPFLGRSEPRAALIDFLTQAHLRKGPRVCEVKGALGSGKSRLVEEAIAGYSLPLGLIPLIARSSPLGSGGSRDILAQWTRQVVDLAHGDILLWARARGLPLDGYPGLTPTEAAEALVSLGRGLPREDGLVVALGAFLALLGPTLLVADDHQWCRPGTRRRLALLLRGARIAEARHENASLALIKVIGAPGDNCLVGHRLHHEEKRLILELGPLSTGDFLGLLPEGLKDGNLSLTPEVAAEAAGGLPLHGQHLSRVLRGLGHDGELEGPSGDNDAGTEVVVAWLRQVVQARLDTLDPDDRRVLRGAAVVGVVFWDGLLTAMGVRHARARLEGLEAKGFIERRPDKDILGCVAFAFKQELVREIAYQNVLFKVRRLHHQVVAAWLTPRLAEVPRSMVAHHWIEGGEAARGAEILAQEGNQGAGLEGESR